MSNRKDPEPKYLDPRNPTLDELRAHGLWRMRNPGRVGAEPAFSEEEQRLAQESCLKVASKRPKPKC
jgi:hypothetical protein